MPVKRVFFGRYGDAELGGVKLIAEPKEKKISRQNSFKNIK
jgi:hypothetical protein